MLAILSSHGGKAFRKMGAGAFDRDFVRYVKVLLESEEQPYDMPAR
jgi:hypothetical protein